jgi:flagellin-specific chaperone FliS
MNEYGDILNRIVEEFYDTGKVVLKELDLPDELKWQSGAIRNEIDQLLKNAKGRFNKGLYQKEKEDYEQFLEIVIGSPIEDEYQEEIETAKGRIEFIEKFLPQKKEIEKKEEEKTSFEQSIENIQTQELTGDFYSKIISANPKKVREAFDQNPCLYNEIINVNPDIRKFIIKNSGGEPKNCVDGEINACLTNKNPFVTHIENNDEISNNDKKELKSVLVDNAIKNQRRVRETCEDNPMSIINKYVTTFDSKKKDIEEKLPEDSILNKNIETKLKKCYSIIQSIMTEMNENKVVQQIPKTKNIFSDLMDSIVTYTKGAGENMPSTELVDKNVEGSLNQIIYDLYQLLLIIQSYDVYDDKEKTQILNIIKNISDQVNNKEGLSENFFKIREIRNQKYEKSFACGGYFEQTKGGNSPKITSVTNNVQFLEELLEDSGKTPSDIVTIIYNEINPQKITESLEKHDIKSNEEITLENGTIIPKDSKIEVKLTSRYSDYHLSEFFGVYKNKPLDKYTDKYNQVISELKEMLKGDDKGIIGKIIGTTAGIFYENYMYTPISNVKIEWSDMGQRPTEKRLSLRVTVEDESKISQWTKQNGNCNCEPFLKGVACPQNESTDRLDNIIETFFDTGKFIL